MFSSGAHVGQYIVVRELGRGAMATVYEATHQVLGKRVALKALHPHLAADADASARFLREGRAATLVRNPHVVDVFDVGTHDSIPFLVMELLEGVDLATHLQNKGRLPLAALADTMLPVVSAVHAAHQGGVIHRDLKPSNVVLAGRDGDVSPTVLDFGISKVTTDPDGDPTGSAVLLGTVPYLSPEQTRSARNASPLSDQYALGVMLYECATGRKPFHGSTPYSLMHAIVSAKVTPPSVLEPSLPTSFDGVVLRAMHRDPKRRFASVRELGAALLPWASEPSRTRWTAAFGGVTAHRRVGPSRRVLVSACAAIVLALVCVGSASRAVHSEVPSGHALAVTPGAPPADAPASSGRVSPPPEPAASNPTAESPSALAPATVPGTPPTAARKPAVLPARPLARGNERGTNGALILE